MKSYRFSASALIEADIQETYKIIADYRNGHLEILPKPPFVSLHVKAGGFGAGTIITFQMMLMGKLQTYQAEITEPKPGSVLVETDLQGGFVTTYLIDPINKGTHSQVTITTDVKVHNGISGVFEGWLAKQTFHPVYVKELERLAAVVMK